MLLFKLIILGDAGVGKTALMNNYLSNGFQENEPSTIGVEFGSKTTRVDEVVSAELLNRYERERSNHLVGVPEQYADQLKMQIWGCSGQERFHSIVKSYYRNVKGVLFVCDLTNRATFNNLRFWIKDFEENATDELKDVGKVIVANKTDLVDKVMVTEDELSELSKELGIPYFLVSSKKDRAKVDEIFNAVANQVFEHYLSGPNNDVTRMQYISGISLGQPRGNLDKLKSCGCSLM
jgi:Ras-related protein Rab-1A